MVKDVRNVLMQNFVIWHPIVLVVSAYQTSANVHFSSYEMRKSLVFMFQNQLVVMVQRIKMKLTKTVVVNHVRNVSTQKFAIFHWIVLVVSARLISVKVRLLAYNM